MSLEYGRALVREVAEEVPNPPVDDRIAEVVARIEEFEHAAQQVIAEESERGYQRLQADINRQAEACLERLEKFREAKRQRLQLSILNYQQRLLFGEDMDIAIRRAQYQLDRLDKDFETIRGTMQASRES